MGSIGEGTQREADIKGQRLLVVVNHPEWQEFVKLCEEVYETNLRKLLEKEDPEARGAMKALQDIFFIVNRDIKFGMDCRKKIFEGLSVFRDRKDTNALSGLPR